MDFISAITTCFRKYGRFSGRAHRSEFWYFNLFLFLMANVRLVLVLTVAAHMPLLPDLAQLMLAPAAVAVAVRRLHDIDRSGWWWWLLLVPGVNLVVLVMWFGRKGTVGANRFGDDPLACPPPCGAEV